MSDTELETTSSESPYFIDDLVLKDQQMAWTEEEKQKFQTESLAKKSEGNTSFGSCNYEEAAQLYTEALRICPLSCTQDRAVLYSNRGAARARIGENEIEGAIEDCSKAVELNPSYVKALLRRAKLYQQTDKLDEALADYREILKHENYHAEAYEATIILPGKIQEKNEKMRNEMFGKLKDLGNMIFKPFGLSTDNFELKKNDDNGGYNINFNPNKT